MSIIGNSILLGQKGNNYSGDYAYFDMPQTIPPSAFKNTAITDAFFSKCTSIGSFAFQNCTTLTNYSFPECITIWDQAFASTNISIAYFPKCTSLYRFGSNYNTSVFSNCSQLKVLSFPAFSIISNCLFSNYRTITDAYFSNCSIIYSSAFQNCTALKKLVLTYSWVVILQNQNALTNTNVALSIYVPSNLVNSYKTATNWTYYSNKIISYIE